MTGSCPDLNYPTAAVCLTHTHTACSASKTPVRLLTQQTSHIINLSVAVLSPPATVHKGDGTEIV